MAKTVPNSLCSHRSEGISGLVLFSFLSSFLLLLLLSNMLYLFGASSFPWNPQKGTRMCRFASFFFLVLTNLLATLCSVFMSIFAGTLILNRFFYPFSYPSSLYIIKSSRYRRHRLQESRCMAGSHPPSTVCVCVCVCVCVWGGGGYCKTLKRAPPSYYLLYIIYNLFYYLPYIIYYIYFHLLSLYIKKRFRCCHHRVSLAAKKRRHIHRECASVGARVLARARVCIVFAV